MKSMMAWMVCAVGLLFSSALLAQAPADAPAGTTGVCKDGTYSSAASKRGACSGHKGVKEWYGTSNGAASSASGASASSSAAPASSASHPAASSASAPVASSPAPSAPAPSARTTAPSASAAPGGGAGQVWVNHKSKVYHCSGDRWYGKTKDGEYMSESDASAKGYRPDHNKPCK